MTNPSYTDEQVLEHAAWQSIPTKAMILSLLADRQRLQAEVEALRYDRDRLNWLALRHVEVRIPARYGSISCFLGAPEEDEVLGDHPWDIRATIDAARANPNETKEVKS